MKNLEKMNDDELIAYYHEIDKEESVQYTRQLSTKVFLNSGYGAFGNEYFRAFDVNIAEAITLSGQLVSKWLFGGLNDYLNKICGTKGKDRILAGDTDSVYITLEDLVNRFIPDETDEDKIIEFLHKSANTIIEQCIEPSYQRLQKATGCTEQLMNMDREIIGSDAFWRKKKNYAIRILDDEGNRLKEPKYKIMGLEPARSTFREDDRKSMEEAIHIILNSHRGTTNDDFLELVENYREEYFAKPIHEVGKGVRVRNIEKWIEGDGVKSGTPNHIKASINYNQQLKKYGLENRYPLIEDGDSIFVLLLKVPNPTRFEEIAHKGMIPKELGLEKYYDYDTMFEKNFFNPVKSYADVVGWKAEDTPDLTGFFE